MDKRNERRRLKFSCYNCIVLHTEVNCEKLVNLRVAFVLYALQLAGCYTDGFQQLTKTPQTQTVAFDSRVISHADTHPHTLITHNLKRIIHKSDAIQHVQTPQLSLLLHSNQECHCTMHNTNDKRLFATRRHVHHAANEVDLSKYQRSRKLCSIISAWFDDCEPQDDDDEDMSLWHRVHPVRRRCSPRRSRTLLPTSSSSTKLDSCSSVPVPVLPASPSPPPLAENGGLHWNRSAVGLKKCDGNVPTMSRRHDKTVLSRELLVGMVAVGPTRTSMIYNASICYKLANHRLHAFTAL